MNDTQNLTIVLLLVTAAVLGVMVYGTWQGTEQAALADSSVRQGDYIMVTGAWSDKNDFLYVMDIAAMQINAYFTDVQNNRIELADTVNVERAFAR